jgi:pyrroline-5-carboxylate reductase
MLGVIGTGNMGSALARGLGQPVLASDADRNRAQALVHELGGEIAASNGDLAQRADAVVLAHKPAQLQEVAADVAAHVAGKPVISILGGVTVEALTAAYPDAHIVRVMPNTPVQIRQGVVGIADGPGAERARELLAPLGEVVVVPEALLPIVTGISGVGPAYVALLVEATVDAAVRRGMPAPLAARLTVASFAGSAALVGARDGDTLGVRREVTSPGGSTARGLARLEANGVRTALDEAMGAVVDVS